MRRLFICGSLCGAALAVAVLAGSCVPEGDSAGVTPRGAVRGVARAEAVPGEVAREVGEAEAAPVTMTETERLEKFFTYDEKYYSTVDYNRLQQTRPLKPGEKLPCIRVVNGGYQYVLAGREAPEAIEVRVPAGMPCTFHAQDMGRFRENGKNIITVKADAEGIARVHYVCTQAGGSLIMAHSPEASGWARIQVVGLREREYNRLRQEQPQLFAGTAR